MTRYQEQFATLQKYQREHRSRHLPAEQAIKKLLETAGLKFIYQKGFMTPAPSFIIADFYLPKQKTIIEVDGGSHADRAVLDARRDEWCRVSRRFNVIRIRNDEALTLSASELLKRMQGMKRPPRAA